MDELEHYGIPGMKHGVRRGPPYPIGSGKSSGSKKGSLDKKKTASSKRSERAKKRAEAKAAAQKKREEKQKAAKEAVKRRNLESPKRLYKHRKEYTKEEIDQALKRFEWEKKLRDYSRDELDAPKREVDIILGYADTAIRGYNTAVRVINWYNKNENMRYIPNVGQKSGKKKKKKDD